MAFTYVLSTDIGKARLRIADTGGVAPGGTATSGYAFEDEEWTQFISDGGSVGRGCVRALDALLVSKALRAKKFAVPGLDYDDTGALSSLKAMRDALAADEQALSMISVDTIGASSTGAASMVGFLP